MTELKPQSLSLHIRELARELLDDIELGRTSADAMILKASRLARFVGNDEIRGWLWFEMNGYNSTSSTALKYMGLTGRWENFEAKRGYWGPLSQQEALIEAQKIKLASMRIPNSSNRFANMAVNSVMEQMNQSATLIMQVGGIRTRVLGLLHQFVSSVYYEKEFEHLSETIFERFRQDVDTLISTMCGDVLQKIPSVMNRLSEGDGESIAQALITCRRIVEAFADAIYPPTEETFEIDGNRLKLDASKHQNRINAYIASNTHSRSVRQRLRQNLAHLFDRVSTGVHQDVTATEARSLFLNTYLFLGEVLHLGKSTMATANVG